ncbi:hypothetical protein LTR85_000159 [Meristemomyces frigidus]|nr:hypothetical protein LTR85_000159 [Meristemomyces frigidus]
MMRTRAGARGQGQTQGVFRFMDLPPELRVRIYEELLCGKTIHIGLLRRLGVPDPRLFRKCQSSPTVDQWAERIHAADSKEKVRPSEIYYRHLDCDQAAFDAGGLNILSVCRQTYNEASLLHLKGSTFVCDNMESITKLFVALSPTQAAAIARLKLVQRNSQRSWTSELPAALAKVLKGLKHLEVYAELVPLDYDFYGTGTINLRETSCQDDMFKALRGFQAVPLRSVQVTIVNGVLRHPVSTLVLKAWEARVKTMVMPGVGGETDGMSVVA